MKKNTKELAKQFVNEENKKAQLLVKSRLKGGALELPVLRSFGVINVIR